MKKQIKDLVKFRGRKQFLETLRNKIVNTFYPDRTSNLHIKL